MANTLAALAGYDWGKDLATVRPIDDAVIATQGDAAARRDLETRLAEVLATGASRDAKGYVCRKLTVIGSAQWVSALAALLADKDLSHMARYALERIPATEAARTLRNALPETRRRTAGGSDRVARHGATRQALNRAGGITGWCRQGSGLRGRLPSLGRIGGVEAGTALGQFASHAPEGVNPGRRRRVLGVCRAAFWPTARRRKPGALQVAAGPKPAQARAFGGHPRPADDRRKVISGRREKNRGYFGQQDL